MKFRVVVVDVIDDSLISKKFDFYPEAKDFEFLYSYDEGYRTMIVTED